MSNFRNPAELGDETSLPRGRHKLSRSHVLDSQRRRLVSAILECIAERGYVATTISDVVSEARVRRNAFYELFDDKADCFLAACDEESTRMLDELSSFVAEDTWLAALARGMRAYLRWWQNHPGFALAYLVELPGAGRRALEQRDRTYARFEAMFEALGSRARAEQPELPPLRPFAVRALVASITEIVAQEIRAGRLDDLEELGDDLLHLVVRTISDDRTADRATPSGAS
jgi:AcrR family transcriptional regulator